MKIKIRKTDALFSKIIRRRDSGRCQYCNRLCERYEGDKTEYLWKLEASHYIGRGNEATRFLYENVTSLCFQCHNKLKDYGNKEYDAFMGKRLGKNYAKLLITAFQTQRKRDDKLDWMWLLQEAKKYGIMKQEPKQNKQCALHKLKMCTLCHYKKTVKKKSKDDGSIKM